MNKTSTALMVFLLACPLIGQAQVTAPIPQTAPTPPATAAPAASAVTLRFQFRPGMSRSYNAVIDMNGTLLTGQSGAGMPISQHLEMILRQTVEEVRATDGAATIITGLEAMKIRMNGQEKSLPQSQLDQMQAMTTTVVTPTGKTLSTTLSAMLRKMTGGTLSGEAFNPTGLIETLFLLPDGPLKVGDTWHGDKSTSATSNAPTSTYTLKSIGATDGLPIASITRALDGNLNTMIAKEPISMKVMSRTTGTGETEFDTKEGTVIRQGMSGNSTITVISKDPQTGTPQSYRMQLQTTVDVGQLFTSVVAPNPAPALPPVQ